MQPKQNRRRLAAAVLAFAATSTLAACGSESAEKPEAAAEVAPGLEAGSKLSEADAKKLLNTAVDAMPTVHVTMDIKAVEGGKNVTAESEGDFQSDPAAFQSKMTVDEAGVVSIVELISVGESTFMRVDGEKQWMKDDGMLSGMLTAMMPSPFTMIESIEGEISEDSTTYVGQEEVAGTEAARYSFSVGESVTGEGDGTLDSWVDSDGKLVRVLLAMGEHNEISVDFSNHGEKLAIAEPAAADIMDMG
ncbi:LppX_LprAFG lipoprotein [Nocardioides albus]|uniref:LppX_LprAFG lipoprotein n=1 Tax=Nocardioides albus TaxID=1841 RepID=A0A7W5A4S1_9ACTN|nr:LppX_LprAFG lipoprotein [Nocardioides albus]MBB3089692.1 hypothetical protein [Nocardioides albus]GGU30032.1 hypothetical protein GCM10007979_30960 [Nocardioides albus]